MKLLYLFFSLTLMFAFSYGNSDVEDSLLYELSQSSEKARICNELAEFHKQNNLGKVKVFANDALSHAVSSRNAKEQGKAYLNLGDYHYYSSDYDSSIIYYYKSLEVLNRIRDNENIASAFSNIGSVYFSKGNYKEAIKNFKKAAFYQAKTNDLQETAVIYNNIATVYFYIDEYENSIDFYQKSLALKKKENDKASVAKGLNNIANVYEVIGNYEKAIDYYYQAIAYCDETGDDALKSTTLSNIAGVYKNWGQYNQALDLYQEALTIKIKNKDKDGQANVLNNIGVVYRLTGNYEQAERNFEKAKSIFIEIGNMHRLARTYSNLGRIKEDKNNLPQAIEFFTKAVQINDSIQNPKGIVVGHLDLARAYLSNDNMNKAEFHLIKSEKVAQSHQINALQMETYKLKSDLYAKKGSPQKALDNYKKYTEIKDSLFTIEKHQKLNELNTKYETDKKNKEIELLKVKDEKQKTELYAKEQERNFWVGFSILALVFGIFSVYFFWNKKQLSDQLKSKNKVIESSLKEKEVLLREIHHRVKNNLQIITSLLNMQSRFLNDDKSKEIVNESKNRIKSMSLIHQKLYQEKDLTGIETTTYFTELIESIMLSYGVNNTNTKLNIDVYSLLLDVDTAIPLGLIINELVSNAFKHGVSKDNPEFTFKFEYQTNMLIVIVKDNGKGMPNDLDIEKSKTYGMKLIKSLSKKLKADVEFKNQNGLEITMRISKFKISKHSE